MHYTTTQHINPNYIKASFAPRGLIPVEAQKIKLQLISDSTKFPFDSLTDLAIGDPMLSGQKPLSFNRAVLSAIMDPSQMDDKSIDVQRRAKYLNFMGNIGCYGNSAGNPSIREIVSKYIYIRDSTETVPKIEDIILTDGATSGIMLMMTLMINNANEGVMIPIPQFPLYSALIKCLGANEVPYYLDESKGWSVTSEHLTNQYDEAVKKGIKPKILVAINPGNPTGQVFDYQTIADTIKFCYDKKLIIFADEVYQENIYNENKKFISFRKVSHEIGIPVELYSFHSISKGITGECGLRGGYLEISNPIDPAVHAEIHKTKTFSFWANTVGQIIVALMLNPPSIEEGFTQDLVTAHKLERETLLQGYKRNAIIVYEQLNTIKGVSCQHIDGAFYAFPSIYLPDRIIQMANSQNIDADTYYCLELLKCTGIVVVPGSGFRQIPGSYHFRMTILLSEEKLMKILQVFKEWHENFISLSYSPELFIQKQKGIKTNSQDEQTQSQNTQIEGE